MGSKSGQKMGQKSDQKSGQKSGQKLGQKLGQNLGTECLSHKPINLPNGHRLNVETKKKNVSKFP